MSNSVKERYLLKVHLKLDTPLSISSGEDYLTDSDIIRDFHGNPIVPGTTIAGAMRDYCGYAAMDCSYFGYERIIQKGKQKGEEQGKMSSYFISDIEFSEVPMTSVRDHVKLTHEKTAKTEGKFGMEIIEKDAEGSFYIEVVIRENEESEAVLADIKHALYGIDCGDIRFGMKKTRGFGRVRIQSVYALLFDKNNAREWSGAYEKIDRMEENDNQKDVWLVKGNDRYIRLEVPLRLTGGISIRQYQAKKNEPDFKHIESKGNPIVPGTSITGAIRSRIRDLILQLQLGNAENLIDTMFGYVITKNRKNKKAEKTAQISAVVVDEVDLQESRAITMVRNGISRFEGVAKEGTLFKEITYVGGHTKLVFSIRKTTDASCEDYKWQIGLLLLAIKDLQNGYLPIGGAAAIGRGIFETAGEITIDGEEITDENQYYNAIVKLKNGDM